ncbi:putative transporter C3H1.06c [Daldinia childiae]|uniref:putative transporter C3H1.06c n=1 Tax=Daldinia childiae TaxID=326645 RepID=UPI001445AEDB|nr:putative transporter C3H1.06c [Daldinia childiae]KAF3058319.1 putative transporter C3H1.06c [Daldinia childiae]
MQAAPATRPSTVNSHADPENITGGPYRGAHSTPKIHVVIQKPETDELAGEEEFKASWRLWVIIIVIMVLSLTSGLDSTIITTSLPTIARDIGGARQYVWIANIFGRRNPLFVAIALFALGSGIGGGATNVAMLIAGRVVQGFGTGGIAVLPEIIICDLIPPRSRGPWLSITMSGAAIGTTLGPIIGGTLAERNWRWIFWLNLPISAVSCIVIFFALNVQYTRSPTWKSALARVDFFGTAIFVPSLVSLYFGLIMGGTTGYPWSSWRIIMPIVLGIAGWIAFHFHQASRFCREPTMPPHLFKSRTSVASFLLIFLASITLQAVNYFLPVYFQGVKGTSALQSGVNYLPFALAIIPFGIISGVILSKTGRYKILHWAGFSLSAIGLGLFSTFRADSTVGAWIGYQVLVSGGAGFIFTATLPSTLAALPESYVATATGTYAFVRSLGFVWGVTMSSIVFNGQVNDNLDIIDNVDLRRLLADGAAYTFAAGSSDADSGVRNLPDPSRSQVIEVYERSLSVVWLAFVGISCLGFLATFIEKHIELRESNETEFGLKKSTNTPDLVKAEDGILSTAKTEKAAP